MAEEGHKRVVSEYVADLKEKGVKSWTASSYGEELNGVFCLLNAGYCPDVDLLSRDRKRLERDVESLLDNLRFLKEYGGDAARLREVLPLWIDFRGVDEPNEAEDPQDDAVVVKGKRYSMDDVYYLFLVCVLKKRDVAYDTVKNYLREMKLRQDEAKRFGLSPASLVDDDLNRVEKVFNELNKRNPFKGPASTSVSAWKDMLGALLSGVPFMPQEAPFDTLTSLYKDYLIGKVGEATIVSYVKAMNNTRKYVLETQGPLFCRLLFSTDRLLVEKALKKLWEHRGFRYFSKTNYHHPSAALKRWGDFIAQLELPVEENVAPTLTKSATVPVPAPVAPTPVLEGNTLDWDNILEAVGRKPSEISFRDGSKTDCETWKDVYVFLLQKLFDCYPYQMKRLINKPFPHRVQLFSSEEGPFIPIYVKRGVWAEGRSFTQGFLSIMKRFMDHVQISYWAFIIRYKNVDDVNANDVRQVVQSSTTESSPTLEPTFAGEVMTPENDSRSIVDWDNPALATFGRPCEVSYRDGSKSDCETWKDVYKFVLRKLLDIYPDEMKSLIDQPFPQKPHLFSSDYGVHVPLFITKGIWACGLHSADRFFSIMKRFMTRLHVPYSSFVVCYRKDGENTEVLRDSNAECVYAPSDSDFDTDEILIEDGSYMKLEWNKKTLMTNTTPVLVQHGDMQITAKTWRKVYKAVLQALYKEYKEGIWSLVQYRVSRLPSFVLTPSKTANFVEVGDGIWAYACYNANDLVEKMTLLMNHLNAPFNEYTVLYYKDGEEDRNDQVGLEGSLENDAEANADLSDESDLLNFANDALFNDDESGDEIEKVARDVLSQKRISFNSFGLSRFAQLYEDAKGSPLPQNYDVKGLICRVGFVYEEKNEGMFVRCTSKEANKAIAELIKEAKERGNRNFYYEKVFDKNYELLSSLNIHSATVLEAALKKLFPRFVFKKNYFALSRNDSPVEDVARYLEMVGTASYEEILQELPYLDCDDLRLRIGNDNRFVSAGKRRIALVDFYDIDEEDVEESKQIIEQDIEELGSSSLNKIVVDRSAASHGDDMIPALQEILFIRYLRDTYNKTNSLISSKGDRIKAKDALAEYCRTLDKCTLDELRRYELERFKTETRYFKVACQEMLRVDSDAFRRLDSLKFDVQRTDEILASRFGSRGSLSIEGWRFFDVLPNLEDADWNGFLLESYIRHKSARFTLSKWGRLMKSSLGGIIVPKGADFEEYEEMLARVLASELNAILEPRQVESLLEKRGYQVKDVDLNVVVQRAKRLRNVEL